MKVVQAGNGIMTFLEEKRNEELVKDEKENISKINSLLNRTILELKKSDAHVEKIVNGENENAEGMMEIKQAILSKIYFLESCSASKDNCGRENSLHARRERGKEREKKHEASQDMESSNEIETEMEEEMETSNESKNEIENENEIHVDIELSKRREEAEEEELTFFEDFQKNNSKFQMTYLKKKEIVGYTASGNAMIINNKNFVELINNSLPKNKYNKRNSLDTDRKSSMGEISKCIDEEENYFSETSCSSSSIISLHSFVRQQNNLRIRNNREDYVKHKYFEDAYVNHRLEDCSDCSERSLEWFNNKSDNVFYYSNLLKEDKKVAHKGTLKIPKKFLTKKKWNKPISPFYKYIYFKHSKEDDTYFPVFVNKKNGKSKLCNLKRKDKHSFGTDNMSEYKQKRNKWELDPSLFSYKTMKLLNSAEEQKSDEETEVKAIESTELLSEYKREVLEIERTAENLLKETKRLNEIKRHPLDNLSQFDRHDSVVRKYKDFIEKKSNFRFKPLCNVEKINLKIKIFGSDGTVVKHKRLERLSIDKSQTFGYLAKKLGRCFQLSDENIENIKIFFDGDVCDKNATFDDETIGLQDDFQLDVRFPQTKEKLLEIQKLFFDQCYPIIHPDYYQID